MRDVMTRYVLVGRRNDAALHKELIWGVHGPFSTSGTAEQAALEALKHETTRCARVVTPDELAAAKSRLGNRLHDLPTEPVAAASPAASNVVAEAKTATPEVTADKAAAPPTRELSVFETRAMFTTSSQRSVVPFVLRDKAPAGAFVDVIPTAGTTVSVVVCQDSKVLHRAERAADVVRIRLGDLWGGAYTISVETCEDDGATGIATQIRFGVLAQDPRYDLGTLCLGMCTIVRMRVLPGTTPQIAFRMDETAAPGSRITAVSASAVPVRFDITLRGPGEHQRSGSVEWGIDDVFPLDDSAPGAYRLKVRPATAEYTGDVQITIDLAKRSAAAPAANGGVPLEQPACADEKPAAAEPSTC